MNEKIKEYKKKINWNVWKDVTPLKKAGAGKMPSRILKLEERNR